MRQSIGRAGQLGITLFIFLFCLFWAASGTALLHALQPIERPLRPSSLDRREPLFAVSVGVGRLWTPHMQEAGVGRLSSANSWRLFFFSPTWIGQFSRGPLPLRPLSPSLLSLNSVLLHGMCVVPLTHPCSCAETRQMANFRLALVSSLVSNIKSTPLISLFVFLERAAQPVVFSGGPRTLKRGVPLEGPIPRCMAQSDEEGRSKE